MINNLSQNNSYYDININMWREMKEYYKNQLFEVLKTYSNQSCIKEKILEVAIKIQSLLNKGELNNQEIESLSDELKLVGLPIDQTSNLIHDLIMICKHKNITYILGDKYAKTNSLKQLLSGIQSNNSSLSSYGKLNANCTGQIQASVAKSYQKEEAYNNDENKIIELISLQIKASVNFYNASHKSKNNEQNYYTLTYEALLSAFISLERVESTNNKVMIEKNYIDIAKYLRLLVNKDFPEKKSDFFRLLLNCHTKLEAISDSSTKYKDIERISILESFLIAFKFFNSAESTPQDNLNMLRLIELYLKYTEKGFSEEDKVIYKILLLGDVLTSNFHFSNYVEILNLENLKNSLIALDTKELENIAQMLFIIIRSLYQSFTATDNQNAHKFEKFKYSIELYNTLFSKCSLAEVRFKYTYILYYDLIRLHFHPLRPISEVRMFYQQKHPVIGLSKNIAANNLIIQSLLQLSEAIKNDYVLIRNDKKVTNHVYDYKNVMYIHQKLFSRYESAP